MQRALTSSQNEFLPTVNCCSSSTVACIPCWCVTLIKATIGIHLWDSLTFYLALRSSSISSPGPRHWAMTSYFEHKWHCFMSCSPEDDIVSLLSLKLSLVGSDFMQKWIFLLILTLILAQSSGHKLILRRLWFMCLIAWFSSQWAL